MLCIVLMIGLFPIQIEAAPAWPDNITIQAEGGIVIDAETGTILYGKNIHTAYYPASITKILTALIVIEHSDLDEMVTFSHNAVYNVEAGSSSAGLDEGDVLSVRDCLYALLLKSANEAGNALAEHVAGSIENFTDMMNAKAASLGCQDSHFANPSGLNNPNHYTSAYDMALIGRAALSNDTFMEIDSTLYYDLPPTRNNKEGLRIYPGHKMIKKNMPEYYSGALGGKTGYTSLAGNTLVTFARRDGMTLVAVVLNGHSTHYSDTKAMLNFGFKNFISVSAADFDTEFASVENDMTIAGLSPTGLSGLELDPSMKITVPKGSVFSSVTSGLSYDLTSKDPAGSIAKVQYYWDDRNIGFTYVTVKAMSPEQIMLPASVPSLAESSGHQEEANFLAEGSGQVVEGQEADQNTGIRSLTDERKVNSSETLAEGQEDSGEKQAGTISSSSFSKWLSELPGSVWVISGSIVAAIVIIGCGIYFILYFRGIKEEERMDQHERQAGQIQPTGIPFDQFDILVKQRRFEAEQRRIRRMQTRSDRSRRAFHHNFPMS